MPMMIHTKFRFNRSMVTFLASGPVTSSPLQARRRTQKAGPDKVKYRQSIPCQLISLRELLDAKVMLIKQFKQTNLICTHDLEVDPIETVPMQGNQLWKHHNPLTT